MIKLHGLLARIQLYSGCSTHTRDSVRKFSLAWASAAKWWIMHERFKLQIIEVVQFSAAGGLNLLQRTCLHTSASLRNAAWPFLWEGGKFCSLLLASFLFLKTKRSVFDWGLKVSVGVFLLKHLWLQLCGQKLTIKPPTPLEITEIFLSSLWTPFFLQRA